ncbi:hypothetical protein B4U79_17363 [Dinothrombium tinctorium]|uniref:Peptidase M12B domain-containing protein n=1 Tax=Dinothrombium tinctorium TaxID=1965070 RepID=A0A443RDU3_9ACAR|nr:hypothetical protein B4U79_17363 [Dinothrombium tinctorium]
MGGFFERNGQLYEIEYENNIRKHFIKQWDPKIDSFKCGVNESEKIDAISGREEIFSIISNLTLKEVEDKLMPINVPVIVVADFLLNIAYSDYEIEILVNDLIRITGEIHASLKINVTLAGLVLWKFGDFIEVSSDPFKTLFNFIPYNSNMLKTKYGNCYKHALLLTTKIFQQGIIGLAYNQQICDDNRMAVSVMSAKHRIISSANIFAHELAHSLGIDHDYINCNCPQGVFNCIMNPTFNFTHTFTWSECTKRDLLSYQLTHKHDCLLEKPSRCITELGVIFSKTMILLFVLILIFIFFLIFYYIVRK